MPYLNVAFLHQYLPGLLAQCLNLKHVGPIMPIPRMLEHQHAVLHIYAPSIPAFGQADL